MRSKLLTTLLVVVSLFLLATNPVVADAAKMITGKQIKDGSVTGKDVNEKSLATVPSATKLAPLKSGQTQSGIFAMASANTTLTTGYLADAITYPRPLAAPIPDANIIDTVANPDAEHCPGPGEAAPGYLCLYFDYHSGVELLYGYSEYFADPQSGQSIGLSLFAVVDDGTNIYADGVWTVTAP